MLLGFVYYFYAFSEECIASIRKGRIWIDENIIKRIYLDDDGETIGEKSIFVGYGGSLCCSLSLV